MKNSRGQVLIELLVASLFIAALLTYLKTHVETANEASYHSMFRQIKGSPDAKSTR